MKPLVFKCSQAVENKKSGRKVKCGRFLCEITNKIVVVCAKCGTKYSLTQQEDGRWNMAILLESILKINQKKELNHGKT